MRENDLRQKEYEIPSLFSMPEDLPSEPSEENIIKMNVWSMGEDIKRLKKEMKEVKKLLSIK